jgi:hypothetical protein
MSKIKNEAERLVSNNSDTYKNQIKLPGQLMEKKEEKEEKVSKSCISRELNTFNNSKERQILIKDENKKMLGRKRIYKIFKRKRHNGFSYDNNAKIIIKHFVTFFLKFINVVINKGIRNKNINKIVKFEINYMLKSYIKIKDITTKTVEDLLKFKLDEKPINQVNDITKINNHKIKSTNNTIEKNEKQIKDIKSISSLFDNLFKTKVICIFNEIYIKNKKKEIDLSIYGINGLKIDLDENYQTFEMIKEKYKDNEKKLKIFERIINDKFVEPKPKIMFMIEKKNNKYL